MCCVAGVYVFERRLNAFGMNREQAGLTCAVTLTSDFLLNCLLNGFKSTLYDTRSLAAWRSAESRESSLLPFFHFSPHNEQILSRALAGTSAVAGDSSLAGPVHGNHYPLERTYCRDRGSSPCSDCDRGCVDRRWFARRDGRDQRHRPLP